ncbi:MAG: hypothetical protein ACQEW9_12790 [Bacteroidota bacterium]|uniref:Uncharacterized protein n=1 Tax=Algoriphagus faecimaris TaxID=686796 RepID=A0A1G6UYM0_9BACT|nr:hypothetical protein [Algoriphagus faecimaris]SDD46490.1 hypothetical protein SAMN04488104_103133 [Algoriphagus faecimaris]
MKIFGIVLVVIGIIMLLMTSISFTTEETVIDAGPIQVNADKERSVEWPTYAGGIVLIAGVVLIAVGAKKK